MNKLKNYPEIFNIQCLIYWSYLIYVYIIIHKINTSRATLIFLRLKNKIYTLDFVYQIFLNSSYAYSFMESF